MGKLLLVVTFFFFAPLQAQDTVASKTMRLPLKEINIDTAAIGLQTFPKNFKKKYHEAEFVYEAKAPEKNALDRLKEWLADWFKNLFHFTNNESAMNFVEIVLKVLAVLLVVFVIYLIVKSLMNKEGRWIFGKSSDTKLIRYDEIEKNLHTVDFEPLIKAALASGEKRLSIRYYYLWLLKRMAEKQLIEWDIEKTNSDYHYEIKTPALREKFAYLSYLYDYVWYGDFELDEHTFSKTKADFENAIRSV